MNKTLTRKLKAKHDKQARSIRKLECYESVKHELDIEYAVAREVAKARQDAGMTQKELAAAMGTTQSVVSRIERGSNVSIETLDRYVSACGHQLQVRVV